MIACEWTAFSVGRLFAPFFVRRIRSAVSNRQQCLYANSSQMLGEGEKTECICKKRLEESIEDLDDGNSEYMGDPDRKLQMEQLDESLKGIELIHKCGSPFSHEVLFSLLQKCVEYKDLAAGRRVHSLILSYGLDSVAILGDHLMRLFAMCGSLKEANLVFSRVSSPSVYTWHAIILAHAIHRESVRALELYHKMEEQGVRANEFIFVAILKACGSLGTLVYGRLVHGGIIRCGLGSVVIIGNMVIDMYVKCGSLAEAHKVFAEMSNRNVVSWSSMIAGYSKHGQSHLALKLFERMQEEDIRPNKVTVLCILKACGGIGALGKGKLIHDRIIETRLQSDVVVGNTLIDMYARCGNLEEAQNIFNALQNRTVVSWNAMIAGYTLEGHALHSFELFQKMKFEGIRPNAFTYSCVVKACGSNGTLEQGMLIHEQIVNSKLDSDLVVGNTLIDMYVKCGSLKEAHNVFDGLTYRDVVTWSSMIAGYAQHGNGLLALELFKDMQQEGMSPDKVMFLSILKACGNIGSSHLGKLLHNQVIKCGLELDLVVGNSLIDMYGKCGSFEEAHNLFDRLLSPDVVSWGGMLAGYVQHGLALCAFDLFQEMQLRGITPDSVAFSCIVKACGRFGLIGQGRLIHEQIIRCGLESNVVVGNALVDVHAKLGYTEEARIVFDLLPIRDVVSWNTMVGGYAQCGYAHAVFELFEKMRHEGVQPDKVTFLCFLRVCSSVGSFGQVKLTHYQIISSGFELDTVIGNALLDAYTKCGHLEEACSMFAKLPNPSVVSWGTIITGHAQHGNCRLAGQCLEDMQRQGFKPNGMIYASLLSACSHAGQLEKGYYYFKSMREDHSIAPSIEHYNCMVDLLSRAGCLNEAKHLLKTMPVPPDTTGCVSLLTACRTYGDIELGRQSFHQSLGLDPDISSGYVLMSSIYADFHLGEDVWKTRELQKNVSAWKKPGAAWIEVNNTMHEFIVGDKTHPQSDEMDAHLQRLRQSMEDEGYLPQLELALEALSTKEEKCAFYVYPQNTTMAFGLLSLPEGTAIRVTEHVLVACCCHIPCKFIPKTKQRNIVIIDAHLFASF